MPHDTAYFMGLPYTITLRKDEDGDFVVRIAELQGCVAHGATEAAALRNLRRMQELWIQDCIEAGSRSRRPTKTFRSERKMGATRAEESAQEAFGNGETRGCQPEPAGYVHPGGGVGQEFRWIAHAFSVQRATWPHERTGRCCRMP